MGDLKNKQCCFTFLIVLVIWNVFSFKVTFADVLDPPMNLSYYLFRSPEHPKDCIDIDKTCSVTRSRRASGVYTIKPVGSSEPFEVYCDNDLDSGGWTVIERRTDGFIDFNRTWNAYRDGFGFLGSEFWLGNEKLACITNQKKYQLRFEFENAAGETYHLTYDHFRIGDEWDGYSLNHLGEEGGTAYSYIEWCPTNRNYEANKCEKRCSDPNNCITSNAVGPERCICPAGYMIQGDDCIPQEECGCFVHEKGVVLMAGESVLNVDCTSRKHCRDNQLIDEDEDGCSDDATCEERDGDGRGCYCNDGFLGNGVTCKLKGKDCYELYVAGERTDGVYTIYPTGWEVSGFRVYCEMSTNGGGWTVFQRRSSASVNFYRLWNEYKNGFGLPASNHWLGNDKIHDLTSQKTYQLRVDLDNSQYYALYRTFSIAEESDKYRLSLGTYSGNAGYNSMNWNSGDPFSTRDQDNDGSSSYNCAQRHRGAWWYPYRYYYYYYYNRCFKWSYGGYYHYCSYSNLNGDYNYNDHRGIFWYNLPSNDCGIPSTKMRIRPAE